VLSVELNAAAENPMVDVPAGDIANNGNFYTAYLGLGLDAARAATDTVAAYRIVLCCELVAAVRALGLRGRAPAAGPLRAGYDLAAGALDPRTEDRPLDADVDVADRLLPALAALPGPQSPG
jgi:histidine ammonia-lyase